MNQPQAGAGLPNFERLFVKHLLVPTVRIVLSWKSASTMLKRELAKIEKSIEALSDEQLRQEVHIGRVFGIEHHSRDFSINMVLEHLSITGSGIMSAIERLSKEESIEEEIRIEDVKPHANASYQMQRLKKFYEQYFEFIDQLPKKRSKMIKAHPWFVEFNNRDWHIFNYLHTFVHRRQIQAIAKKLRAKSRELWYDSIT